MKGNMKGKVVAAKNMAIFFVGKKLAANVGVMARL